MKILIKFPTRDRAAKFFSMMDLYISKLSGKHYIEFVISCDVDDPTMNNKDSIRQLDLINKNLMDRKIGYLHYYFGERKNKVFAINRDMEKHTMWDILLLASDDMTPVFGEYDHIIVEEIIKHYPDGDGVIHFPDGFNNSLNTLAIMGKKYYDRFNYIYNPVYYTWHCDNEFMEVATLLNRHTFVDKTIIRHDHVVHGRAPMDRLWVENENDSWKKRDGKIFTERKSKNFGLKV